MLFHLECLLTVSSRCQLWQKMDLGPCPRAHQEKHQIEFQMLKLAEPNSPVVSRIEQEWHANLFGFVDDCDRRIAAAHRRLEKTPEENAKTTALVRSSTSAILASHSSVSGRRMVLCPFRSYYV